MIKELKYITLEYSNSDLEYIDELVEFLEKETKRVVTFFKIKDFGDKVKVKLYDDLNSFREDNYKIMKREVPLWLAGLTFRDNGDYINALSLNEYQKTKSHENGTLNDLKNLILHEFVHSCHYEINNNMRIVWLMEGLATNLSGQYVDNTPRFTKDVELEKMIKGGCSYINYYTMFKYVYDTYGYDYIMSLLTDIKLLESVTPRLFNEALENINLNKCVLRK